MDRELLEATVAQLRRGDTVRGRKVFGEGRFIDFSGPAHWRDNRWVVGETPLSRLGARKENAPSQYLAELGITTRTEWRVGDLARIEWGSNELVVVGVDPLTWDSPMRLGISNSDVTLIPRIVPPRKPQPGDSVRDRNDTLMVVIDIGLKKALVEHTNRERRWVELETLTLVEDES